MMRSYSESQISPNKSEHIAASAIAFLAMLRSVVGGVRTRSTKRRMLFNARPTKHRQLQNRSLALLER
jgi:hypothetical protein